MGMSGFGVGLLVGGGAILVVAFTFAGTPDGLENLLGAVGEDLLGLDQVLVGHFEVVKEDRAWLGTLVYAPGIGAAMRIVDDLSVYRVELADATPEPVRDALCQQDLRCHRNGTDRLMEDLRGATLALRADTQAALLGDITVRMQTRAEGLLVVAVVEAAPTTVGATEDADRNVTLIVESLRTACNATLGNGTVCGATYVDHSVRAVWNEEWDASLTPRPDSTTAVMGPLSWSGGKVLPNGEVVAPPRDPLFLPTAALLYVALGIAVAVALHFACDFFFARAFVPLPPIAILVGVGLLFFIDAQRALNVHAVFLIAYGILFVAYGLVSWRFDLAGIQFFTFTSTFFIFVVSTASFLTGMDDLLLDEPLSVVSNLYEGNLNTQAANLAARTLTTAGVASLAVLTLNAIASLRAYRDGLRELPPEAVKLVDDDAKSLQKRLMQLQVKLDAGDISAATYASILARVYGRARWAKADRGEPRTASVSGEASLKAAPAEGQDLLKDLRERHVKASEDARSLKRMALW